MIIHWVPLHAYEKGFHGDISLMWWLRLAGVIWTREMLEAWHECQRVYGISGRDISGEWALTGSRNRRRVASLRWSVGGEEGLKPGAMREDTQESRRDYIASYSELDNCAGENSPWHLFGTRGELLFLHGAGAFWNVCTSWKASFYTAGSGAL